MRTLLILTVTLICSNTAAFSIRTRNGIGSPGFESVSLAYGGIRSVGFGDPMCLLTNPSGISLRQGNTLFSISYGPSISNISFMDGEETYSDSWVNAMGIYSFGMKIPVFDALILGVAAAKTAELPLRTVYYIPDMNSSTGDVKDDNADRMDLEADFGKAAIGLAWDAAEWLSIGGAVGLRITTQSFDMIYADTTGFITQLSFQESELCFDAGITLPLEPATLGLSWSSGGKFTESVFSMGGMVGVASNITTGAELEIATHDERNIYTGRVFGRVKPTDALILRAGAFYGSATEEISRQGPGVSAGVGYIIGRVMINGAFSWSTLRGDRDNCGYEELESFEGTTSRLSVGLVWGLD